MRLAHADGAASGALVEAASRAFDHSYLMVMYVIAGALGLGAVLTTVLLRRHGPGSVAYNVATH